MTEQSQSEITDTGKSAARRLTPMRVVLGACALVAVAGSMLFTFGVPQPSREIVLDQAFVRGAVSQIGTDDDARITKLHVGLGDAVSAGDPLVDLSDDRLRAARDAAAALVARYRADLDRVRAAHRIADARDQVEIDLAEARERASDARVDQARAEVAFLQTQVSRSAELSKDGYAAQATLDTRKTDLEQARADLQRRKAQQSAEDLATRDANIAAGSQAVRRAERDSMAARLAEAQAELAGIDARLAARTLTALDDGIVVDVPSRPGASVGTDDPILSIWDPDRTWMLAWVDQGDVGRIRVGDSAEIRIDTLDTPIDGTVRRILVAADGEERVLPGQPISPLLPERSRFAIHVDFDAGDRVDDIFPGMSGAVAISPSEGADQISIASRIRQFGSRFF